MVKRGSFRELPRVAGCLRPELLQPRLLQGSEFRVYGSGLRVQSSGFKVYGSGFRVQGSGFRVYDLGLRVEGLGFGV